MRRGRRRRAQRVGPAVVAVGGGAVAVGDGIAQHRDGGDVRGRQHVDALDLIPVLDALRVRQLGSGDEIARGVEAGGARAGMAGLLRRRRVVMQADGEVAERRGIERHGIGDVVGAGRDRDVAAAGEGQSAVGSGVDAAEDQRGPRDVRRQDVQRLDPEDVGDVDPERLAAEGEMHGLAQRRALQRLGRQDVARLGDLLRRCPGAHPVRWRSGRRRPRPRHGHQHCQCQPQPPHIRPAAYRCHCQYGNAINA